MPQFTTTNRKTGQREYKKIEHDSIVIGRLGTNEIVLNSKTVSRKHAEVTRIKNDYFLVDLESGNGTFLNNSKLKPHEKNLLKPHDIIRIEEFEIVPDFEISHEVFAENENTDSGIIEIKMIKKVLSALDSEQIPSFEVLSEPARGKKVLFTDNIEELVIGRDSNCTLAIDAPIVSRRHAVVHKKWGGINITDLKSKNGTYVNGEKIEERLLKDGDIVTVGNIEVAFRNPQEIDFNALSREYEKRIKMEEEKRDRAEEKELEAHERKLSSVSEEARASVEADKQKNEPEPEGVDELLENIPKSAEKEDQVLEQKEKEEKRLSAAKKPFSPTEMVLMGIGFFIFISALLGLVYLLF